MTRMSGPLSTAVIWYTSILFGVFATEATISAAAEEQSCSSSGGECLAAASVANNQVDQGKEPTAFVQTRAKAKYKGRGTRQIVVGNIVDEDKASVRSNDEENELGDGDKELILEDFRSNLSDCMAQMTSDTADSEQVKELDLIYQAEVLRKAHALGLIDEENIVWAAVLAAQDGARRIAREQSRNALLETFAKHNMTNAIRDKFVEKLYSLAHLCNDTADADALVSDESQLLSTDGGPLKAGEAQAAVEIAEYVISKCSADSLDLEWFFAHAASIKDASSCGTLIDQEIKTNLGDQAVVHDAHVQTVLALHNEENQLGHDYAKHLKHVIDGVVSQKEFAHTGADKLNNALLSDLSGPTRAKLRYLENKHFPKLHGATKRELCAQREQLKEEKPDHFSVQSDTVYTKMYKCMCEDDELALVCRARHHEDIAEEQPRAFKRMQEAVQEEERESSRHSDTSVGARANQSLVDLALPPGFCQPDFVEGCIEINGFWCCWGTGKMKYAGLMTGSERCTIDPFIFFGSIADPKLAITAKINIFYGWPAASCDLKLKLGIGVTTSMTGHWTDLMVNFNIFMQLDICLGGVVGAIANVFGWVACQKLADIRYYPFIGKLTGSLRLPVFQAWVVSAWARFDLGGPVHDVTNAIKNVIKNPDHHAFRVACPGCPGTSAAAALLSYDESSDNTANTDDAANLGFWRRRRRRRRDRRRRDRRRNICIIRPCNGGSAKGYWKAKMEDARGGLFFKITGEGCALWWCKDLANWEKKWSTPAITGV